MSTEMPAPRPASAAVETLCTPEHFVLWSARVWSARRTRPLERWPDLAPGFAAAGIEEDGLPAFRDAFDTLVSAARRPLQIRGVQHRFLSCDEALLLRAVALLQHQRLIGADSIFAEWLSPAAARFVVQRCWIFAAALSGTGLVLPLRNGLPNAPREAAASPLPDPGLRLLQ